MFNLCMQGVVSILEVMQWVLELRAFKQIKHPFLRGKEMMLLLKDLQDREETKIERLIVKTILLQKPVFAGHYDSHYETVIQDQGSCP